MNCYIDHIYIFSKDNEKRDVPFKPGLNIITGTSKTGKSALIEIVDYCFASKFSNIPIGEISKFGYIYVVVLKFTTKYIVLARRRFDDDGNSKMYVIVETRDSFKQGIGNEYFNKHTPVSIKDARSQLEKHLNLVVTDMSISDEVESSKKRKASLRDLTSFLFQHQNLVANKHALFYRFDDYYKRQATIEAFPVLAGWVDDKYYSLKRELDECEKELKKKELNIKREENLLQDIEEEVQGYFKNYFSLNGLYFDDSLSFDQLQKLKDNLPEITSRSFTTQGILNEYNSLKIQREELSSQLHSINNQIKELEDSEQYAKEFQIGLKTLEVKSNNSNSTKKVYHCPLCAQSTADITKEMIALDEARENLSLELRQISNYAVSYQKQIDILKKEQYSIKNRIDKISSRITEIEIINKEIEGQNNITTQILYAKAQIELRMDMLAKSQVTKTDDYEIHILKDKIAELNSKLSEFGIDSKYKFAFNFFRNNMNIIASKLDFETLLKPPNLEFDFDAFLLYHSSKNLGKISLNQMGSGANWLACHLSLFMTFLHFFSIEKHSCVPTFLFLDQPSQVYFPSEFKFKKDSDIKAVEDIYIAILDEIKSINKQAGFEPQVIITDHADKLDLGEYEFESYVCKRWKEDSPEKGLI